jgi:lipopolysaccharide transport protein LptA
MMRGLGLSAALFAAFTSAWAAPQDRTVITSRSVRVLDKGRLVEFTGDVRLTRGSDFLSADRLVTEEERDFARAWGHVVLRRDDASTGTRWEAWGDRADYSPEASSGTLWGDAAPVRARRYAADRGEGPAFELETAVLRFQRGGGDRRADTAHASGRVRLHQRDDVAPARESVLWSDEAFFDGASGEMRLTGAFDGERTGRLGPVGIPVGPRPYAQQKEGVEWREMAGRTIRYRSSDRRLAVEGEVQALVRFETTEEAVRGPTR